MNSRNALAIVAAGAAILATAACGSDDDASDMTYTDGEACIMAGTPASAVTSAASPYIYKTDPQPEPESAWSKTEATLKDSGLQATLKENASLLDDLSHQITTSVAAKDDAKTESLIEQAKAPFDAYLAACKDIPGWTTKDSMLDIRKTLDAKPSDLPYPSDETSATPTSSTPTSKAPKVATPAADSTTQILVIDGEAVPTFATATADCSRDADGLRIKVKTDGDSAHFVTKGDAVDTITMPSTSTRTEVTVGRGRGDAKYHIVKSSDGDTKVVYRFDGTASSYPTGGADGPDTSEFVAIVSCTFKS